MKKLTKLLPALALILAGPAQGDALSFLKSPHGLAFCSAADIASTIAAHERDPSVVEINPIYGDAFREGKYAGPVLLNLAVVGLGYHYREKISPNIFLFINVLRCGVAGANLRFVF